MRTPSLRVSVLLLFWACGDDAGTSPDGRVSFDAPPVQPPIDAGPPDAPPNPATGAWRSGFRLPGLAGSGAHGYVALVDPANADRIYVGGTFTDAAGTMTDNVAVWDGTDWTALGAGLPSPVRALAIGPDGKLYAGGSFDSATTTNNLAVFDGTAWSFVPGDLDGRVLSLVRRGDRLLVGGGFTHAGTVAAQGIAAWDPAGGWAAIEGGTVNGEVATILPGDGNAFCVGGSFDMVGTVAANNVACFDGDAAWTQLGDGLPGIVDQLVRAPDQRLFAGGSFNFVDPQTGDYRAGLGVLATNVWIPFAGGVDNGSVNEVRAIAFADDGDLLIGGTFNTVDRDNPVAARNLARWDFATSTWSEAAGGVSNQLGVFLTIGVDDIVVLPGGDLVIAGVFSRVGNTAAVNVARLAPDATALVKTGVHTDGVGGLLNDIAVDGQGRVVGGGYFSFAGTVLANNVGRYGPSGWEALGDGLDGVVRAVQVRKDGSIVAGGEIFASGAVSLTNVATFDGTAWAQLGDGLDGSVRDLYETADGTLYACGEFTGQVARLDGESWVAVGPGLDGMCTAMTIDAAGHVVATGLFTASGDTMLNGIGFFDAGAWHPYGTGMGQFEYGAQVAVKGTDLLVAGSFTVLDGVGTKGLARFDGTTWNDLSSDVDGGFVIFFDILPYRDGWLVSGIFETVGGHPARSVAWFDGTSWFPLGDGLDDLAEALAVSGRTVWAGGPFLQAGGVVSAGLAAWDF